MHLVHKRACVVAKLDIISNFSDDIIHLLLSYVDLKYAIQTSFLSKGWKYTWTSMPYLNFDSRLFDTLPEFAEFVKQALSHRDNDTHVSAVDLKFTGSATQFSVQSIVNYAYSHGVTKMTIVWFTEKYNEALPQIFFESKTLKHLTIAVNNPRRPLLGGLLGTTLLMRLTWDFPALETLKLSGMRLCSDYGNFNFFSKCVNLKDLTLDNCSMYGCNTLHVCAPQLCNLTITDIPAYARVLNLVAPKLESLTASVSTYNGRLGVDFLHLSSEGSEGFNSLEKVDLCKSNDNKDSEGRNFRRLLDLFEKLSSAKFLILDMDIIQTLSSNLGELSLEPGPFQKLECVKINTPRMQNSDPIPTIPTEVRDYLLGSSPNATFIIDSTQIATS